MKLISSLLLLITVSVLFININGYTQPVPFNQHVADSITSQLPVSKDDTTKVKSLILLAQMYIDKANPGLVMKYAQAAVSLSKKINYPLGTIGSLGQMAFLYSITGDWPNAIIKINEAIPLCEKENSSWLIYLYNLMFINTAAKNDFKEARLWAQKAANHPLFTSADEMFKWPTYMQLGLSYEWENQLDSAQYYADILKKYLGKYHHADLENNTHTLLGNIARKRKKYDEALYYYRIGNQDRLGISWVYDEQNKTDSAIYYAQEVLKVAQVKNDPRGILESAKILARCYSVTDPKLSNKYLLLYIDTKDTLFNANKIKAVEEIRLSEQKKRFDSETQEAVFKNRLIQLSLIGIALLLLVFMLFLYRNNQIKQKSNKKLEKAYGELKSTQAQLIQSEKMASLGELTAGIAHEIQNPLNFVNNFSEINTELIEEANGEIDKGNMSEVKIILNDIKENEGKINHHGKRADAIVKGMLQHSQTSIGQKQPTDINKLADEYLRLAYHGLRAKDKLFNATLKTDYDESISNVNIIPQDIGRVILNLINNAFYAVAEKKKIQPENYEPTVSVSTKRVADKVEIKVSDNGIGIPPKIIEKIFQPFFTTKPTGQGTGLGLSLSYDVVKAHGGELRMETKEKEGTKFTIILPVKTF